MWFLSLHFWIIFFKFSNFAYGMDSEQKTKVHPQSKHDPVFSHLKESLWIFDLLIFFLTHTHYLAAWRIRCVWLAMRRRSRGGWNYDDELHGYQSEEKSAYTTLKGHILWSNPESICHHLVAQKCKSEISIKFFTLSCLVNEFILPKSLVWSCYQ